MATSYDDLIERLAAAASPGRPSPPPMRPYLEKVERAAYTVVDEDVEALRELGFSEDEIFEQTVAAAVGAGLTRLEAALGVLR